MERLIGRDAERLLPGVGIQVPPNLADWWPRLVAAGATDLGGLSANGDHISPEHPFPSPHQVRKRLAQDGVALTERLCVYARYIDPEWVDAGACSTSSRRSTGASSRAAARGAARRRSRSAPTSSPASVARARAGEPPDARGAHRAVRRDAARGDRGHAPGRRRAARRAGGRHGDLRRQPQRQRLERLHRRLRVLRLRAGQALARRLRARPRGVRPARARGRRLRRDRALHAVGHPSRTGRSRTTWAGCAWRKETAPQLHLHAYSPMEIAHMCDISGLPPDEVFARLRDAGLGSTPGTAAEVLHDGVRERISPNKLPVARWVEIIEASHARRAALDLDGDVRPHRGAVGAGRAHARRARAAGAHGRDHRVRAAVVHPVPHAARAHARRRGDLARGEPQAHRRLPPRARPHDPQRAGQLGEDGPRRRHRGAALGRQRPRRHAHGGVDQPPGGLLPRRAPRPAAADRRRPRRGPPGRRAHDALRAARPATRSRRRHEDRHLRRAVRGARRRARRWRRSPPTPRPPAGTASSSGTTCRPTARSTSPTRGSR